MARARLDRRLRLSPEGHGLDDLLSLTRHALTRGEPFLVLSFHSPSLLPGCTPYVRSEGDRARFLETLDGCLRRVLGTGRVVPADPAALIDRDDGAPS